MTIFLFLVVMVSTVVFLLLNRKALRINHYISFWIIQMVALGGVIYFSMLYLVKDNYYYNIINRYFALDPETLRKLMFTQPNGNALIRALNISVVIFAYSALAFPVGFVGEMRLKVKHRVMALLAVIPVLQILLFDPDIYEWLYKLLYPEYLSYPWVYRVREILQVLAAGSNLAYLAAGCVILALYYWRVSRQHHFKLVQGNAGFLLLSHTMVAVSYSIMYYWCPIYLVRISKVADYRLYLTIPLGENYFLYQSMPAIQSLLVLVVAFAIYRQVRLQMNLRNEDRILSRSIDAATVTTKVFCHYLKNEVLALKSEVMLAQMEGAGPEEMLRCIENIDGRCDQIFQRLDTVHQSIRTSRMRLRQIDFVRMVGKVLVEIKPVLQDISISEPDANFPINIMADEYYLSEAIINIIRNAAEALQSVGMERRRIDILLEPTPKWVSLTIKDYGVGIAKNEVKQIFDPFYSSKSSKTNWGVGLSVARTIIAAHDGRISIHSQPDAFTEVSVFLPQVDDRITNGV